MKQIVRQSIFLNLVLLRGYTEKYNDKETDELRNNHTVKEPKNYCF